MNRIEPSRPHLPGVDVAGTGLTVLDRIYTSGEQIAAEELGGSCGNVLLSLAMLKRAVAPVLSLGDDDVGAKIVETFALAGAETTFIALRPGTRSPVIAEFVDETSREHTFAFRCPTTGEEFARYEPVGPNEIHTARDLLEGCRVFYVDRISETIVDAMEAASASGAVVYLEPSSLPDEALLAKALNVSDVVKFSHDRIEPERIHRFASPDAICISTFGAAGLELRQGETAMWCEADEADLVRDTCGSGDMVSVGIIDWIVRSKAGPARLEVDAIISGVKAGQRLAAANCAFIGARGLFRERGADYARWVLERIDEI